MKFIISLSLFLLVSALSNAQKVLGKPTQFENPIDYSNDQGKAEDYIRNGTKEKSHREGWLVMSDRDNNPIYEKPSGSQNGTASFKEFFYVVEEEMNYVKVVKASGVENNLKLVNLSKICGWMHKKNLLLWNSVLHNPFNQVPCRVFLASHHYEIQKDWDLSKLEISAFSSPNNNQKLTSVRQPEYYNVLKIDLKNRRYLISSDEYISILNPDAIIGWVENRRCIPINTRIFLEPNFDVKAFQERKNNPNLRVKLYRNEVSARNNEINNNAVASYKDIVEMQKKDNEELVEQIAISKSNPRRLNGQSFRMPLCTFRDNVIKTFVIFDTISNSKVFELQEKIRLVQDVFTPYHVKGAKYPLYKYVVFFSQHELSEYHRIITRGASIVSADQKRKQLFEFYKEIILQFAGKKHLKEKNVEQWTQREVFELLLGIYKEGISPETSSPIKISDILSEEKMNNQAVEELLYRFKDINENLGNIIFRYDTYEFAYKTDVYNTYFWIDLSDLIF